MIEPFINHHGNTDIFKLAMAPCHRRYSYRSNIAFLRSRGGGYTLAITPSEHGAVTVSFELASY